MNNFWKVTEEDNDDFGAAKKDKFYFYESRELCDNLKQVLDFAYNNPLPGDDPAKYLAPLPTISIEHEGKDLIVPLIPFDDLEVYFRIYKRWKIGQGLRDKTRDLD